MFDLLIGWIERKNFSKIVFKMHTNKQTDKLFYDVSDDAAAAAAAFASRLLMISLLVYIMKPL